MSESNFIQKVGAACNKKEDLYQKSKTALCQIVLMKNFRKGLSN